MKNATLSVDLPEPGKLAFRLETPGTETVAPTQSESHIDVSRQTLGELQRSADAVLRRMRATGFVSDALATGNRLYRNLVPETLRKRLKGVSGPLLVRTRMAEMPWELFHDGEEFWGLRYALGRTVVVEDAVEPTSRRSPTDAAPRALIVGADARKDLPFVRKEVDDICKAFERVGIEPCVVSGSSARFVEVIDRLSQGFDVIHYCGHVVSQRGDAGLLLVENRVLSVKTIGLNLRGSPIVFLNGCTSVRGTERRSARRWAEWMSSVASGFLSARHGQAHAVVGTLCDVTDGDAGQLASTFYRRVLEGAAIGEALRAARMDCRRDDATSPTWLSFALFGDPSLVVDLSARATRPPFGEDGLLVDSVWQDPARQVLAQARAEALGHSADVVSHIDLMLAIFSHPIWRSVLALHSPEAGPAAHLIVRLLRQRIGSSGPSGVPKSPIHRRQFDAEAQAIIAAANVRARPKPIGVRDLLGGLLRIPVDGLERLLVELGLERTALQALADQVEEPAAVVEERGAPDTPKRAKTATDEPKPPAPAATPPAKREPPAIRIFDGLGQLRTNLLTAPVIDALMVAAGDVTALADEAIEPVHLVVALGTSRVVQRGLRFGGSERAMFNRLARATLYGLSGKHPFAAPRPTLPDRREFSADALAILERAVLAGPPPLTWERMLDATCALAHPQVAALARGRDPQVRKLVTEFLELLARRANPPRTTPSTKPAPAGHAQAPAAHPSFDGSGRLREACFDAAAQNVLSMAATIAGSGKVAPVHVLAAALGRADGLLPLALAVQGIAAAKMAPGIARSAREPSVLSLGRCSPELRTVLERAGDLVSDGPICESELVQATLASGDSMVERALGPVDRALLLESLALPVDELRRRAAMPVLHRFGRDLTAEAAAGKIPPLIGRQEELRQIALVLARKEKSNVLLVGEAGVGKTAIVEGLARDIAAGTAPLNLRGRIVFELDTARVVAGTGIHGELESRVQALLSELESHPEVILFIDEFHTIVHAGGHGERTSLTFANQLKPALGRGHISVIGATTEQEYALTVERDPALMRRFRLVRVPEPSVDETLEILRRIRVYLEEHYGVAISDGALVAAVMLAERHLPGNLPDSARDVIVDACAARMVDQKPQNDEPIVAEEIRELVAKITRVPAATLSMSAEQPLSLEEALGRRVVGQPEAIRRVAARLRSARVVRDPRRPLAVLFFTGPTGVGKTELARAIADEYCGDRDACVVIPMNEYAERVSLTRLMGVGPGWVGHDEEPILISALKKRARSVIVLDEIDKAHPEAWRLLMRLFDEGHLVDPRSNVEVNGREAIYVMTANLVAAGGSAIGFGSRSDASSTDSREALRDHFPPEFVNRIDEVIMFQPLDAAALDRIVTLRLHDLAGWIRAEHHVEVEFDPAVTAWIARRVTGGGFGAREVARVVQVEVREPLSLALCELLEDRRSIRGTIRNEVLTFESSTCSDLAGVETSLAVPPTQTPDDTVISEKH